MTYMQVTLLYKADQEKYKQNKLVLLFTNYFIQIKFDKNLNVNVFQRSVN